MDNCLINKQSIKDTLNIFGPRKPNLEVKTTRKGQGHVNVENITPIPTIILQRHSNVVLGMDIVKINGVRLFATYSRTIKSSPCQN